MSYADAEPTFAEMLENAADKYREVDAVRWLVFTCWARVARKWECSTIEDLEEACTLEGVTRPTAVVPSVN